MNTSEEGAEIARQPSLEIYGLQCNHSEIPSRKSHLATEESSSELLSVAHINWCGDGGGRGREMENYNVVEILLRGGSRRKRKKKKKLEEEEEGGSNHSPKQRYRSKTSEGVQGKGRERGLPRKVAFRAVTQEAKAFEGGSELLSPARILVGPPAREAHRPPSAGDSPLLPAQHHSRRSVGTRSPDPQSRFLQSGLLYPTGANLRGGCYSGPGSPVQQYGPYPQHNVPHLQNGDHHFNSCSQNRLNHPNQSQSPRTPTPSVTPVPSCKYAEPSAASPQDLSTSASHPPPAGSPESRTSPQPPRQHPSPTHSQGVAPTQQTTSQQASPQQTQGPQDSSSPQATQQGQQKSAYPSTPPQIYPWMRKVHVGQSKCITTIFFLTPTSIFRFMGINLAFNNVVKVH
ncbi:uncharacterized protein CEXT_569611 [Caerostris extrusa]|uniref:Uncharacterized protein n=1 Tax=Caerostris extrusa TaxID=172846 RepID=A0AAV4RGA4_CAEEX|nr:uncharacterized protein CEXT_569611 [Caerostris extrusa]